MQPEKRPLNETRKDRLAAMPILTCCLTFGDSKRVSGITKPIRTERPSFLPVWGIRRQPALFIDGSSAGRPVPISGALARVLHTHDRIHARENNNDETYQ